MEWDQVLFKKIANFYDRKVNGRSDEVIARTVKLEDITGRLTLLARALTGDNIEILPGEKEGGWKNDLFYLPASFGLLSSLKENLYFYIFRTVYLSVQFEEKLNWPINNIEKSLLDSRKQASISSDFILNKIKEEYPAVYLFYDSIKENFDEEKIPEYWIYGKYMVGQDIFDKSKKEQLNDTSIKKEKENPTTEIKAKPVEQAEVITVDKKAQEDYVMTHNFEKVETADEFNGVWRGFDGDDSLEEDADALNELNLKHLVRTDEVAHSIYQADFRDLSGIAESTQVEDDSFFLTYPEWNFHKKNYKPEHCKVYLKQLKGGDLEYANKCISENVKILNEIRRKFAQINQVRKAVKKMPQGEEVDIDALIDWHTDLRSGKNPSENIYYSKRKKESDLAILFLLDLSLSTDSYADGNRVLDVEKQAVILFGEVLSEYGVDFAIGGFYSKTRNRCSYVSIKDFRDTWLQGKQRISTVSPEGYTRIGPALRHSKSIIEKHTSSNKWVILLSDGKPNDYDKYEGKYGLADVKQALREMHERHINTYAIAIESIARYYLPQMFGQNHYNILSHPNMLVQSLATLYRRIQNR